MYQDVEYKLAQYAQWCGNPLRSLGYPRQAIYARVIPNEVNPEALPEMSDAEAKVVGDALLALREDNKDARRVIDARFFHHMTDNREIGRRLQLGSKDRVARLRLQGLSYLQGYLKLRT